MGPHLSCISQQNTDKISKGLCDPYTIKDYIIDDTCLVNLKSSAPKETMPMPFSAAKDKTSKQVKNGHAVPKKSTQLQSPEKFINQQSGRTSPIMISRRMRNGQCRRSAGNSCSPSHRVPDDRIYQNGSSINHSVNNSKPQFAHEYYDPLPCKLNGNGNSNRYYDYCNGKPLACSVPTCSTIREGDYVNVQKRQKNPNHVNLRHNNNVRHSPTPISPIHSVGDRSSIGSQKFATVSQRFSFSYDPETMPRFMLQSTPLPADVCIPLAQPIPTPPPTPPVRVESRVNGSSPSKPDNHKGSLTSIVNFLKRQSYADTESLFKVTLRKSRSRSTRRRDVPKIRYLPAISQSPNSKEDTDRPNVVYRPRYYQHRRSLVEGLEKLHILADDPTDGLDLDLGMSDEKRRATSAFARTGRRDSCPEVMKGFNPEDFNRSYSFHHSKRPSEVRALQTLRKCRTVSRPRDGPAPKSPQPLPKKNSRKHAFYFFHIRSSNVHQTECFLFGDVVTELAQRFCCSLRLLSPEETLDLPDGLRRVEVAGPTLKDIKKFLYFLTTSEETITLQRQIQERHTLARKLSRATDKSDSMSPCSPRDASLQNASTSPCPNGACFLPNGYV